MVQKTTAAEIGTNIASVYSVSDENRNSLRRQELLHIELDVQRPVISANKSQYAAYGLPEAALKVELQNFEGVGGHAKRSIQSFSVNQL